MENVEIEHRITANEQLSKSNQHRIEECESRIDKSEQLISTVAVLATNQQTMKEDLDEIKTDVKHISSKSGQKYDNLVDKIVLTIVGLIVGFIFSQFGF